MPQLISGQTPSVTVTVPVPTPVKTPGPPSKSKVVQPTRDVFTRRKSSGVPHALILPHQVDEPVDEPEKMRRKKKYEKPADTPERQYVAGMVKGMPRSVGRLVDRELLAGDIGSPAIETATTGLDRPSAKGIIKGMWSGIGAPLPGGKHFDPANKGFAGTTETGEALEAYTMAGGRGGTRMKRLDQSTPGEIRVARALIHGIPEIYHQLQKGHDPSGVEWYEKDIQRLNAGLIALYGEKTPEGGYKGRFGEIDQNGRIKEITPHLKLFKTLVGMLSPGMNPRDNLNLALHLYETARQAHPDQNPFAVLPDHKGIRRDTGEYDPKWAYEPNERDEKYGVDAKGKPNTKYKNVKVAIDSYRNARDTLKRLLEEHGGNEDAVSNFLMQKQPYLKLLGYKDGGTLHGDLPRPHDDQYNQSERLDKKYEGAWLFGPKAGPFVMNINDVPEMITKDLWFSRSWNRLMGTLHEDGSLQDVPRGGREGRVMNEAVHRMSDHLGLTPSELQAVWWYYEQALYRAMTANAESRSFGETIDEHLRGDHPITKGLVGPDGKDVPRPVIRTAASKRRKKIVEDAMSMPRRYTRPRHPNADKIPLPPADVYESLKTQARKLAEEGRMPDVKEFLAALAAATGQSDEQVMDAMASVYSQPVDSV